MKFSTSPAVEVTMATGIRPTLGRFDFDIGAACTTTLASSDPICSKFLGGARDRLPQVDERLDARRDARLCAGRLAIRRLGHLRGGRLSLDLPTELLPTGVSWALSADFGRSVFGPTSSAGGVSAGGAGLPLPAYNNWRAGLTFTYNVFKLGLNYTDTTL